MKTKLTLILSTLLPFLLAGCGATVKSVTTVSSVETRPAAHYVELLGKKGFSSEKQFPQKLDTYANSICSGGYKVSQTLVSSRFDAKLPVTYCQVNACAGDELLRASLQCNSGVQTPIFAGDGARWIEPKKDPNTYNRLRRSEPVIQANLHKAQQPEKILLAKDLMVWVYPKNYIVLKTVKRPLGTLAAELQVRNGKPNIQ